MPMVLLVQSNDKGPIYVNTAMIERVLPGADANHFSRVILEGQHDEPLYISGSPSEVAARINDAERRVNDAGPMGLMSR